MILTGLLFIVLQLVRAIASFFTAFPDATLPAAFTGAITTASGYFAAVNQFLPVDSLLAIAAFDLAFELGYFIYKMVRWAYQKVPGIN